MKNLKIKLIISIIVILTMIFSMVPFGAFTSKVYAGTDYTEYLKIIPDTIVISEKEIKSLTTNDAFDYYAMDWDTAIEIIQNKIKKIINKPEIKVTVGNLMGVAHSPNLFDNMLVFLGDGNMYSMDSNEYNTKAIKIVWSENFVEADKTVAYSYVRELNEQYFGVPHDAVISSDDETIAREYCEKYKKIITDNIFDDGISLYFDISDEEFKNFSNSDRSISGLIWIYNNNVLYCVTFADFNILDSITVPDEIEDTHEAYTNYAKSALLKSNNFLKQEFITDIKNKGLDFILKPYFYSIYTVELDSDEFFKPHYGIVVVSKNDSVLIDDNLVVSKKDAVNNVFGMRHITISDLSKDSDDYKSLNKVTRKKGYRNIVKTCEMNLKAGDIARGVEFNFEIGSENNGKNALVLHKKHDGTVEEFKGTVENGKIKAKVNELSPFMIALETLQLLGDINENNKVDANDAFESLKLSVTKNSFTATELDLLDINMNGKIDANDAYLMLAKSVGLKNATAEYWE